jgi:hypothetical protein
MMKKQCFGEIVVPEKFGKSCLNALKGICITELYTLCLFQGALPELRLFDAAVY